MSLNLQFPCKCIRSSLTFSFSWFTQCDGLLTLLYYVTALKHIYSTQLNFAWTLNIFIHYKETVFSAANKSILCPVWMLQATDRLQLHLPERDCLDQTRWLQHYHRRSRLHHMVERPDRALLWLYGVQGGRARQPEERLEKDCHHQHRLPDLPHRRLLRGVLRVQEQPAGQLVPGLEVRCAWLCIGC